MEERIGPLLARLRKRFDRAEHVAQVEAYLSSKGFDRGQIGTIVSAWLTEIGGSGAPLRGDQESVRILGPHERGRFSPEAWGYFMGLRMSGLLGAEELEQVIDRALSHIDGYITRDDARGLLESLGPEGWGPMAEPNIVH